MPSRSASFPNRSLLAAGANYPSVLGIIPEAAATLEAREYLGHVEAVEEPQAVAVEVDLELGLEVGLDGRVGAQLFGGLDDGVLGVEVDVHLVREGAVGVLVVF